MPTYEYKCDACGLLFEESHFIADRKKPTESPCPECGEKKVRQDVRTSPGAAVDSTLKPSNAFRDTLKKINAGQPPSGQIPMDKYE